MKPVLFNLAARNLLGHLRRTLLTVLALAVGLAALILLWGFNDGLHGNMTRNFQDAIVGSLQIHRDGFFRRPELALHLEHPEALEEQIGKLGVSRWTERLEGFALAASDTASEGVMLMGMDPVREPQVTRLPGKVTEGRFFRAGEEGVCVLGAATARSLRVGLGDRLAVVAYSRFGELVAEEVTLVGLITSGETGVDRGLMFLPLAAMQSLLEMQGRITSLVLRLDAPDLDRVADALKAILAGKGIEVLAWYEMFPAMQEWIRLHDGFLYLFMTLVLLLVLGGVLNTLLIAMLERTRELGVLIALGTVRGEVVLMVLTETLLIGLAGTLLGALLGIGTLFALGHTGIELGALVGATTRFYVDPVIYPQFDLGHLAETGSALLAATLAAGLYPAWRAGRIEPVEAIRGG